MLTPLFYIIQYCTTKYTTIQVYVFVDVYTILVYTNSIPSKGEINMKLQDFLTVAKGQEIFIRGNKGGLDSPLFHKHITSEPIPAHLLECEVVRVAPVPVERYGRQSAAFQVYVDAPAKYYSRMHGEWYTEEHIKGWYKEEVTDNGYEDTLTEWLESMDIITF